MPFRVFSPWRLFFLLVGFLLSGAPSSAQEPTPCPDRRPDEGLGPFKRLLIRGVTVIDGTGAPPRGPVNILVSGNRITSLDAGVVPKPDKVLDARGMYALPGFVDLHAHSGGTEKAPNVEYCYKLWLAHGVTTIRGVPLGPNDWVAEEKARSSRNEIVAPRIFNYQRPHDVHTPDAACEWVRKMSERGIDGLKLGSFAPPIMKALISEARELGLGTTAHLGQEGVARMNALDAARLGLHCVTHYYGHFEALMKDHVVQPWPVDHNHSNEQHRFAQVARLWNQIHPPGSDPWKAYLAEHKSLGTVFDPTFTIYSANRDVMRARTAEWHDRYTLPSLWDWFQPNSKNHGSYWYAWTTADEIAWRNFYRVWMQLVNDYKNLGGRVTTGSDPGFIYDTWGFGYIEELEFLQEAGFHPLEVIQAATSNGAHTIMEPKGEAPEFGELRRGMLADIVLVEENPLADLKVLLGTGAVRLNPETNEVRRVGGVRYTLKDGIIYDAKKLLEDVAAMVEAQKKERAAPKDSDGRPKKGQ